jgi:hypothetical protein
MADWFLYITKGPSAQLNVSMGTLATFWAPSRLPGSRLTMVCHAQHVLSCTGTLQPQCYSQPLHATGQRLLAPHHLWQRRVLPHTHTHTHTPSSNPC